MRILKHLLFPPWLAAFAVAPAFAQDQPILTTTDGRSKRGEVRITEGNLTIGGEAIALADIRKLALPPRSPKETPTNQFSPLPSPWRSRDVGKLATAGRAQFRDGAFHIDASRRAEGEDFSAFHYVFRPARGDCRIVARVVQIDNPDEDSWAGVAICAGTSPHDHHAFLGVSYTGGVFLRSWGYRGGSTKGDEDAGHKPPYWIKLEREGRTFRAYDSPDGRSWNQIVETRCPIKEDEPFVVGLAAKAHKYDDLSRFVIDNVQITGLETMDTVPMLPKAVLSDGSTLHAGLRSLTADGLALAAPLAGNVIPRSHLQRIEFFHPLDAISQSLIASGRPGVLLRTADFLEAEVTEFDATHLKTESLLFGPKTLSLEKDVDAIVLGKAPGKPEAGSYTIRTQSGSQLNATDLAISSNGNLTITLNSGNIPLNVPIEEILTIEK